MSAHEASAGLQAAEVGERPGAGLRRMLAAALAGHLRGRIRPVTLWNYLQLLGGSVGRLGLSLAYFLALTRALSLADFGFFAGAVAAGTILARVTGLGYGANLLQISATRPRALGGYLGVYGLWTLASLPVCFVLASLLYQTAFAAPGRFAPYLTVIVAEAVVWRQLDTVAAVNSGLGRFGRAAAAYNIGAAARALAALAFLLAAGHDLDGWSRAYLVANLVALGLACATVMPRVRPRYHRRTLLLRWRNALALGGAGLASSAQLEIDKLLVLTFGGPVIAGLYAVCIRVVDLTAVPIRAFNVLMIQRVLTRRSRLAGRGIRLATEAGVASASTAAYATLLLVVHLWPGALGSDIARASPLLALLWAVPALRNLTEYQAELLYAHGRMGLTLRIALVLTAAKTLLLALIFACLGRDGPWAVAVNGVFLVAYGLSALMTYRGLAPAAAVAEPAT